MHYMVTNQNNHQENGTANLRHITSNPGTILPEPTLRFQLSWGNLIIIPSIMVILLKAFQLILTMTPFQIQTPLQLNQLMIMKLITSFNSFTQNMMTIFYMLTSRCFKLDWCSPLLQNFIQYLLCCLIKTEEQIFQSQLACHNFLCLSPPTSL